MTEYRRFPTGAIPSAPSDEDRDFEEVRDRLVGASPQVLGMNADFPASIDCTMPHEQRVQGQPSCVGYTVATKIQDWDAKLFELNAEVRVRQMSGDVVVVKRRSFPLLPRLSGSWPWTLGRQLDAKARKAKLDPAVGLPITGSSYRLNMMGVRDWLSGGGMRSEDVWPDIPANASRLPTPLALGAEPLVTIDSWHFIKGEKDVKTLRLGWTDALRGYELGACSKPGFCMNVSAPYAHTPEGVVFDDRAAAIEIAKDPSLIWGGHAQLGAGYHNPTDTMLIHSTWPEAKIYRARAEHLAEVGWEFVIFTGMLYIAGSN